MNHNKIFVKRNDMESDEVMENEINSHDVSRNFQKIENFKSGGKRSRSPRRLRHEAQIEVFSKEAGGLEEIREKIGLRPSQLCELLKVHPSAWTRWTRTNKAPPYVYQMLDWYLELLEWRGQHQTKPSVTVQAKQDPYVFVPPSSFETKPSKPPGNLTKVMVMLWGVQLLLWIGLILFLFERLA